MKHRYFYSFILLSFITVFVNNLFAQNYIEFEPYYLTPDADGWYYSGGWVSDGWDDSTFYYGCDMEYRDADHWESGIQQGFTYANTIIMPTCWPKDAESDGVGSNVSQGYIQLGKSMYYGTDSATYAYLISPELKNLDSLSIQLSPDVTPTSSRLISLDLEYSKDGGTTWSYDNDEIYICVNATSKSGSTVHLNSDDSDWGMYFKEFMESSESNSIIIRFMSTDRSYFSQGSQRIKIHNIKIYADEADAPFILSSTNSQGEVSSEITEFGDSLDISATINADSLTGKTLNWTVSDASLAKIDSVSNTEIKLIATGNNCGPVIVTATFNDYPSISRSMEIDLFNQVADTAVYITGISEDTVDLYLNEEMKLSAEVYPDNACDTSIIWSSSNEDIVSVSNSGIITGVAVGDAIIKATSANGFYDSIIVTCEIKGVVKDTAVSIIISPYSYLPEADSVYLRPIIYPADATDKTVTWTSSNEKVGIVDRYGNVWWVTEGEVVITATSASGAYDTIVLTNPLEIPDTAVTISSDIAEESVFNTGDSLKISVNVYPENASDTSLTWSSSNEEVATVNSKGVVKAIDAGTTTIKVTSAHNFADSVTITIIKSTTAIANSKINSELGFYPNPATESITISSESNCKVKVTNVTGVMVIDREVGVNATLDVSSLKAGLYIVSLYSGTEYKTVRLIKQ